MSAPSTHERASNLFLDLADLSPEAREHALATEPDAEVREAARALLLGHGAATGPLDAPLVARDDEPDEDPRIGHRVGPWRLEGVLGEGGMGVVYRASRADGAYEREVALKLLHAGPDVAGLASRLRAERQILARLEHPRIARLYDGGVTDDGSARGAPYLVMEIVRGEPITDYAETHDLSTRERVALAVAVCEGVAYAHQHLVVHRDLKPGNILVASGADGSEFRGPRSELSSPSTALASGAGFERRTEEDLALPPRHVPLGARSARVKLLDFGIAKLLDASGDDLTRTRSAHTPAYASPEQVGGGSVTTATDVYALGVILYELLARTRPYQLSGSTASEAERVICNETPPLPSAAAPEAVARGVRGDLDTIVMKALEKEPSRRYPSAEALGADLQRYLDGEPIRARRATAGYRASRFVRRHRAGVGAAALVLLALIGGTGVALWQAREARAEAAKAGAMQAFLLGMLSAANPDVEGRDVRVADLLDRAAADLDSAMADQPNVRADAHTRLGQTYYELGLLDEADAQYRLALALYERLDGPHALTTAAVQRGLGMVRRELADYDGADSLFALSLATHLDRRGERDEDTAGVLAEIGTLRYYTGDAEGSAEAHRRVLAIERALLPPDDIEIVLSIGNLAVALSALGEEARAIEMFEEQARLYRTVHPRQKLGLANTLANLGALYFSTGRPQDAARVQREAVALFREAAGDRHPSTAFGLSNLGSTLTSLGSAQEAEPLLREAVSIYRAASGERHPNVGFPLVNLAKALRDLGELSEAEAAAREAGELFREGFGADSPTLERVAETLASIDAKR
ncbi:serine/threonine-protein kinase [Rubricoccus marinus]|uniref:Protein kinase domain-containing protein n=1 Tax=Rubricoccus marinus TaxID=716817 RepID=A0A259U0F2_9BACT|nr:serine/threonine-protein kinase [Rubricoccus marinus]OZC03482.1 hypothetical protein BSZ36_11110 [Rubricoccus marinus]